MGLVAHDTHVAALIAVLSPRRVALDTLLPPYGGRPPTLDRTQHTGLVGNASTSTTPAGILPAMCDETTAFQDVYPDDLAHCYGCGRLNAAGLHVQSRWDGDESVARFMPRPEHVAIPGYVYGGLIASLIDCHGTGTASAAAYRAAGRPLGSPPPLRFVTAALHVDYLKPTPLGVELEIRGAVTDISVRKVVVDITVTAAGSTTARGQVIAVAMPEGLLPAT